MLLGWILLISTVAYSEEIVHVGGEGFYSDVIYLGDVADMPPSMFFSIGDVPRPENLMDAFSSISTILSPWFMSALKRSANRGDCEVTVNDIDYLSLLLDFLAEKWELFDNDSSIKRDLMKLGVTSPRLFDPAFREGFCEYVRGGTTGTISSAIQEYQ